MRAVFFIFIYYLFIVTGENVSITTYIYLNGNGKHSAHFELLETLTSRLDRDLTHFTHVWWNQLKGLQVCSSCKTGRKSSKRLSLWLFCRTQVLISCVWGTNRSLFSVCPMQQRKQQDNAGEMGSRFPNGAGRRAEAMHWESAQETCAKCSAMRLNA